MPDSLALTLDAMKEQMKIGALQAFREKVENPSPEQINSVNAIVDDEFKKIGMEDLIKDVVPIYQKHLSRSDVEAVIRFYPSPVGQKIRREQPAMARESSRQQRPASAARWNCCWPNWTCGSNN